MKITAEMWDMLQEHLGYTDEQMKMFKDLPRNTDVMVKAPDLMNKTITCTVVDSHGCNSRHRVGETFYFDGVGNLLTKLSPKRICVHALNAMSPLIFTVNELIYAGVDPNDIRFNRLGCLDVGVKCGGWGRIVLEIKVIDRIKK
ncbi:MAG: TIGR04076 family protein [Deltaproteobacteria bacterium]|nr:TIGR04076 family protein [Candidatus Zymogenaceae bacterium]